MSKNKQFFREIEQNLVCDNGHGSFSPDPNAWVGKECGRDKTCKSTLKLVGKDTR